MAKVDTGNDRLMSAEKDIFRKVVFYKFECYTKYSLFSLFIYVCMINKRMKYLFALIIISILCISCSEDTEYARGDNVIEGVWNNYHESTDSLVMTRVFTTDYYSYFSFSDGKLQEESNKQRYSITENTIVLGKYNQTFRILADTLWITNSKQDQTTKYIRQNK